MAGAMDSTQGQKRGKREGFVAIAQTKAGVGRLKMACKDACDVAGAVQETSPSEMSKARALISCEGLRFRASNLQQDDFA